MPWIPTPGPSPTSVTTGHPAGTLHDTPQQRQPAAEPGIRAAHGGQAGRAQVPPFLLFDKPGTGRDVRFRGLLAPGSDRVSGEEDLVAVWRTTRGQRFQNYRARFTVLDVAAVPRAWIDQVIAGDPLGTACPAAWRAWVERGNLHAAAGPADGDHPLPRAAAARACRQAAARPGVPAFQGPAARLRAVRRGHDGA